MNLKRPRNTSNLTLVIWGGLFFLMGQDLPRSGGKKFFFNETFLSKLFHFKKIGDGF